jgi:hypothetical protein
MGKLDLRIKNFKSSYEKRKIRLQPIDHGKVPDDKCVLKANS